jgi:alpha-galactosidase
VNADEKSVGRGRELHVRLRHRKLPLEVTAIYAVYTGHAAIRKCLKLKNTGAAPLRVTHLNIEAIGLALGPSNETTLLTQYGTVPRETLYTGRTEDAGLLIANGRTGQGVAILNEVPGCMKRTEVGGYDPELTEIRALYDTDLMPFERVLAAGEEWTTASVSLVLFRNGDGFNDPHWALPSYTASVLERRLDRVGPPWIFNTWDPFGRAIDEATTLELIDVAGEIGFDIFTIDDGWQARHGEDEVRKPQFPNGLEPVMKAVEARGMKLGLWFPLAAVDTSIEAYKNHPEWAATDQSGKAKMTDTAAGDKAVMCLATGFRDTAAAVLNDTIERFRLAYVKLDLTTIFNAYGEAPGCWSKGHLHGSWSESLGRIYESIAYITGKIYEKHPEVLLDLTFELWGQKHILDAGLLAAGDLDWLSNVDGRTQNASGPRQARQLLYERAASMPVEPMLIGNLYADRPSIEELFATEIGAGPVLLGDLRKLSREQRTWYREKIAWFKKLRAEAKLSESFFPLGSWQQVSPAKWDGFARFARSGDGIVVLFRNNSRVAEARVELPLLPEGSYRVHSVMTGKSYGSFNRSNWAGGVSIPFPGDGLVEILEVRKARG